MRHILLAAAVLAASPASAGQLMVSTPRGPDMVPSYGYRGPAPGYAPRFYGPPPGSYLNGYVRP